METETHTIKSYQGGQPKHKHSTTVQGFLWKPNQKAFESETEALRAL